MGISEAMKSSSRRTLLKTIAAAGVTFPLMPIIRPKATKAAGFDAFYLDGFTKYYQAGPTPDTVQNEIDPGLPNVTSSSNQLVSLWFRIPVTGMNVHSDGGVAAPNEYATIVESQFPDEPWQNGLWVVAFNDPDPNNNHYVLGVFVASDVNSTDWMLAQTSYGVIPPDGLAHNLQIYIDSLAGTVDYLLDGVLGTPANDGLPDMVVEHFTGPFLQPIEGMGWQVGASTYWHPPDEPPAPNEWQTTYVGMMDELMVYSGNFKMLNTPVNNQLFYVGQGNLLRATTFSLGGQEIAGEFPTVYLRGGPGAVLEANSAWFLNASPQSVLPWVVLGVPDPDSPGTGLSLSAPDPYQ
jgi:hypothetical protein